MLTIEIKCSPATVEKLFHAVENIWKTDAQVAFHYLCVCREAEISTSAGYSASQVRDGVTKAVLLCILT